MKVCRMEKLKEKNAFRSSAGFLAVTPFLFLRSRPSAALLLAVSERYIPLLLDFSSRCLFSTFTLFTFPGSLTISKAHAWNTPWLLNASRWKNVFVVLLHIANANHYLMYILECSCRRGCFSRNENDEMKLQCKSTF